MAPAKQDFTALQTAITTLTTTVGEMEKKIENRFASLEQKLESTIVKRISTIEKRCDEIEQYSRAHSVKILGLKLADTSSSFSTSSGVHSALVPIIQITVQDGLLPSIPSLHEWIDIAHPLQNSNKDGPPTIILRLRSKLYKEALMRCKSIFFKKSDQSFTIVDDLTKKNATLLKATKLRDDVKMAWYRSGKIRFRLKDDPDRVHIAT